MAFSVVAWTESEFAASRAAWNRLLSASSADPLFLSWDWQYPWWCAFRDLLSAEPVLLAVYDHQRELAGIAPLYRRRTKVRNFFTVARIEFIGNCWRWRGPPPMRTENLDFIVRDDVAGEAAGALLWHLFEAVEWDELALGVVRANGHLHKLLHRGDVGRKTYMRESVLPHSYYVDTRGAFSDYVASRGKNTRLQLFNRRKQLEKLGVTVDYDGHRDIGEFFDVLNRLHRLRWGYDAFEDRRLAFNREVAERLAAQGQTCFSVMRRGGEAISILYDYRAGGQEYFLQGGFDEQFDRKLALGFLHLGYAVEQACNDTRIERLNLLTGGGKNTSYKERLTANADVLVDVQLLRPRALRMVYRVYDAVRRRRASVGPPEAAGATQ